MPRSTIGSAVIESPTKVEHHECGERHLARQRDPRRFEDGDRSHVREVDREDMTGNDRGERRVPGKAGAGERDIHSVTGCAEQVPSGARRDRTAAE